MFENIAAPHTKVGAITNNAVALLRLDETHTYYRGSTGR